MIQIETSDEQRKIREIQFHDNRYKDDQREKLKPVYKLLLIARQTYKNAITSGINGRSILECGCGVGSYALQLEGAAKITAIDISSEAVDKAQNRASELGVDMTFEVMDCENLEFPDNSFDLVFGSGILHHLDIDRAFNSIGRVLTPGGRSVFLEPLHHNPLINFFRKLTPGLRSEDEHPLSIEDLKKIFNLFHKAKISFHVLTVLLALPFTFLPGYRLIIHFLNAIDQALFTIVPFLRRYAWVAVVELEAPRQDFR